MHRENVSYRRISIGLFCALVILGLRGASAGIVDVKSITTSTTNAAAEQYAATGTGSFSAGTTYTLNFAGQVQALTGFTGADGSKYAVSGQGEFKVRRNDTVNPSNVIGWYKTTSQNGSTINLQGQYATTMETLLGTSNILRGTDNLFGNTGDGNGNNNNIERVDYIFAQGLKATSDLGFIVMERGDTNAHDPFKIAAITSLDVSHDPTDYGKLVSISNYGKTDLVAKSDYTVMRNTGVLGSGSAGDPNHPSASGSQAIGGVLVHGSDLVTISGQTIYGFSLFGSDINSTGGSNLVNWLNTVVFPANTSSTTGEGGIDLVGTGAISFHSVPEPSSWALMGLVSLGILVVGRKHLGRRPEAPGA